MRLKELRDEKNLTQEDIAQAINTSRPNISRWEKELNEPAAGQIVKLADFFGYSMTIYSDARMISALFQSRTKKARP